VTVALSAPRPPAAPPSAAATVFTAPQRRLLAALADALIPAAGELPSASEAGVAAGLLDKVLSLRPDLAGPLRRVLAGPDLEGRDAAARLVALAREAPADHAALLTVVAGGYYLEPRIRQRINYPGQEARPFNPSQFENFVAEGLLDHVLERERATP